MKLTASSPSTKLAAQLTSWSARHPVLAIALVSLLALAINCYPIIFCGKSFVAPAVGVPMLYDAERTLPGMQNSELVNAHGSDTGATLIWGVPLGFVESRSIWEHGELPWWNRYGHSGDTLIGQGIAMLGDPLQSIVIAGHGSAQAHDLKFLLAKFLFAFGMGLLVRRILVSLPLAVIFAALAPYCGAYYYIFNHPVFFAFGYAPWILLSALELLDVTSRRYAAWALVWLLANVGCFNAGHVEVGVMLIGGLNLAALVFALVTHRGPGSARTIVARLGIGTGLFLGITAPTWLSFLAALPGAFTIHNEIKVVQFPFASLLGAFDDVFYRLPAHLGPFAAPAPATSFLIMVGAIYSWVRWRMERGAVFFWVNSAAIALWGGCIFGWVPSIFIAAIPMLNRVGHTNTDFSYLFIIHLTIQCAYGFKSLANEASFRRAVNGLLWVGLIVAGITLLYNYGFEHADFPWIYYLPVVLTAFAAPLLFAFLRHRPAVSLAAWAAVGVLAFVPNLRFGMYGFGNEYLLMTPKPRVVLNAPSPAIDSIKADRSGAFRVAGVEGFLCGDYGAVYGLEGISSCAPLSNGETVALLHAFPGFLPPTAWECDLTNVVAAHPLLNLLNVKYVLTPENVSVQEGLGYRLAARSDMGVLENIEVWPRAFFCGSVVSLSTVKEFIDHLQQNPRSPFIALTPEEIAREPRLAQLPAIPVAPITPATHYQLLQNATTFDIHAPAAGMVSLTESTGRDFVATVNGQRQPILTVNRAFKGLYVPAAGDYHVEFVYRPRYWGVACALFWTACAMTAIFAIGVFLCERGKKITTALPLGSSIP